MTRDVQPRVISTAAVEPEGVLVCDERGTILDSSETSVILLGRSVESLRGTPLSRLAAPGEEDTIERGLADSRASGVTTFFVRLRAQDGRERALRISTCSLGVHDARVTICFAAPSDTPVRQAEERARRLADTQKVIATILELALEDIPLEALLQRTLDLVLWIPWLSIEKTGAIFLVEQEPPVLVMKVHRGLRSALLSSCARVPFGSCLCGEAAMSRTPIYAATLDERHTTRYPGIAAHGHYCVPICRGDKTLGVITTYLSAGHEASAIDLEFLMAVADTLAGVLVRHRSDIERQGLEQRLADAVRRVNSAPGGSTVDGFRDALNALVESAQGLVQSISAGDPLRATAEAIERAARQVVNLTTQLNSLDRERTATQSAPQGRDAD